MKAARQAWGVIGPTVLGLGAMLALASILGTVARAAPAGEPMPVRSPPNSRFSTLNSQRPPSAVPVYMPAGSDAEAGLIDAVRLIGIPTAPTAGFPSASPVAFFSAAALADREFPHRLRHFVAGGGRALITSRLAAHLGRLTSEFAERIFILPSSRGPVGVLALPQAQIERLRNFALFPLGLRMEAPPRVSLTLVGRNSLVVENHNPYAAGVKLTFIPDKWPTIQCLASEGGEIPLSGSSIALQAPPKAAERFRIVSRNPSGG